MKLCRICLSKDGRLYPITSNGLSLLYHQLTAALKIEVDVEKKLPQWLCAECGLRLMSYDKLRHKGLRAYKILCDLLDKANYITEEDINEIDRKENNLQSNLTYYVLGYHDIQEDTHLPEAEGTYLPKLKIEKLTIKLVEETPAVSKSKTRNKSKINYTSVSNPENSLDFHFENIFDAALFSESEYDSTNTPDSDYVLRENTSFSDLEYKSSKTPDSVKAIKQKLRINKDSFDKKKQVNKNKDSRKKISSKIIEKNSNRKKRKIIKQTFNQKGVKPKKLVKKEIAKKSLDPFLFEDLFTIRTLSKEEKMAAIEKKRLSTKYTRAPYKCSDCFKGFASETTFTRHRLRHTDKCGKFECEFCKKRYPSKKGYHRHMISHKATYSCKECKFISSLRCVAMRHGLKHKGKCYQCPQCDKQFVNESSYFGHLRIKHVSHYVCELCGFSFLSAKGVATHKNLKHGLDKDKHVPTDGPTCVTCNIKVVSDDALNTHMRVSHANVGGNKRNEDVCAPAPPRKSIVCEICGQETKDGIAYRSHYRHQHPNETPTDIHTARGRLCEPAMCELCGRLFKSKHNLLVHSKVHSRPKPHQCTECDVTYSSKRNLQQHVLRAHRPGETKEIYPCSVCGKKLANSGNVARHMFLHTGLRPYSCEICNKAFKSRGDVRSHTAHVHLKSPRFKRSTRDDV